jgi:hypothetical protein
MSFVTLFTAGTMAFVLLVPALMVLVLSTGFRLRRKVAEGPVESAQDRDREAAAAIRRAA